MLKAIVPACLAGISGWIALVAWSEPVLVVLASAIGAFAGALFVRDDLQAAPSDLQSQPELVPVKDTRVQDILDALPFGVLIVESDQQIEKSNPVIAQMFGLSGLTGQPVASLRARRLLDLIEETGAGGVGGTLEFSLSRSGDSFLHAYVRPIGSGDERRVLVAIVDETRSHRAQELHRDFVANASHELKTPLAAVSGIIETLLGPARSDPAATERFLGILTTQTVRMTRLVEDLLSLNRIELNERVKPNQPHDVLTGVAEVVDVLGPIAETASVKLAFQPGPERVEVLADRDEMGQLFRNLIENAIKYCGAGSNVRIFCRLDAPDHPDMIGITVEDDGPGIAREDVPRLTERFYRVNIKTSREKGGTGLGLAICKHIVSRHRGRLEIDSLLGRGSRFTVWLPIHSRSTDGQARLLDETSKNPENHIYSDT